MSKNILFIMCDQLRYDYLACTGHPTIRTPNIDKLASRGVRFDRTYVQSPICGPSRMSFYTGRYVRSHGSTWNMAPLRIGEMNIGDHLNALGMRTVLCGKTHMAADLQGMERLGIEQSSDIGTRVSQCGFEVWDRLDGVHPEKGKKKPTHFNDHLNAAGYEGSDPWEHWANSVVDDEGRVLSGWSMSNVSYPSRVAVEDSETAYTARRAKEFIEQADNDNWCLHLSFIKPHWPYVAPAPYHDMYGSQDVIPAVRDQSERHCAHPLLQAYYQHRVCQAFSRDEVRNKVIPVYMGLITQIDDEVGRLVDWLEETGRAKDTVIVFTSDHGDYLGDHWLGEKELFHEPSVRIPLIIMDPSGDADATRGHVCSELVEAIDILPTFIDLAGGTQATHIIEGHSLCPFLYDSNAPAIRDCVFSEYDYSVQPARETLKQKVSDCRLQMIFDGRWKMINAEGYQPMLFDLETDPNELVDLGGNADVESIIASLQSLLLSWATSHHARVTRSDAEIEAYAGTEVPSGIFIGYWDDDEIQAALDEL